ncbi:hypothetical protein IQ268_18815 [Oculatella sp. LEGE 06141]|uniref:hypothetical protein n=1 Tax=Oculatella sp. LEGE 06141 TaxID=1828648 RepID=UPI0018828C8C|nr:hypothetical protein [Oculatella sp. LEGE 06141]MBE9180618.1 hypothetical protein [Oculatella sp. LEGE 06141]
MALFILFALLGGVVGSVIVGIPGVLMLMTGLQQHAGSRRFIRIALCSVAAIATLLITVWWSVSQFQTITPPGGGAPTPDDAAALLKACLGCGLAPGLSLFSAGLVSLCGNRN